MAYQQHFLKKITLWISLIGAVWLIDFFVAGFIDSYYFSILMYTGINIILAVSLNLVNGFTGQFSMGHAGFMSVGGYTAAMVTLSALPSVGSEGILINGVFLLALIAGGCMAAVVGLAVGLPSLRLKGDYLAIVTLGFGEIIRVVFLNMDAVGGARGLPGIPLLSNFGWIYSFAIVTIFFVWRVVHSPTGRGCIAIREDEIAAGAMGVDTTRTKVRAFVFAAFLAGIAGGLFAHFLQILNPTTFDFNRSFEVIIMVVLGGSGSITGSVIAAILLTVLKEALRPLQEITHLDLRMVIYSLLLIGLMLTRPKGIMGTREINDFFKGKP